MRSAFVVVTLALIAFSANARPSYRSQIPNGTVNSCVACHNSPNGGSRNVFGQQWGRASTWADICGTDSDGDGQQNGQELGDPSCIWSGGAAARTTDISNPGDASSTSSDPDGGAGDPVVVDPSDVVEGVSGGAAWMCDPTWIGDGECDCGCGDHDSDCADNTAASCKYNECDEWQTTAGLQLDPADPTLCDGGIAPGVTTCPSNSTLVGDVCGCNAGFSADAAGASCVADGNNGGEDDEGEEDGDDEGGSGCASSAEASLPIALLAIVALRRRRR